MGGDGAAATRVLVVDDERALASVIASYLTRAGPRRPSPTPAPTRSPGPGTTTRRDHPRSRLPELDGIEACRRIRTFSDCYILMVTARGDGSTG
jgi:CheY-like chemotaxis protein